jgi:hypothetical protein
MASHLSDWHEFNQDDRKTHPQIVNSPVQVRFANGTTAEATSFEPFVKGSQKSAVAGWRSKVDDSMQVGITHT